MTKQPKILVADDRGSFVRRAGLVLAGVLAAGGISTSVNPAGVNTPAALRDAPTTVTRSAPGTTREAPRSLTPSVLRILGVEKARRADPYLGHGRPGMDRKTWGMSTWCKNMRLQNVWKGRQPHYRPRAQA